jgi:ribosomal protein L44E
MEVLMATKKVVKKVKKAVKPVLKKKAKPVIKKKAKPVAKKIERYACRVCGLAVTVDQIARANTCTSLSAATR